MDYNIIYGPRKMMYKFYYFWLGLFNPHSKPPSPIVTIDMTIKEARALWHNKLTFLPRGNRQTEQTIDMTIKGNRQTEQSD